jgi:hypothetical protein
MYFLLFGFCVFAYPTDELWPNLSKDKRSFCPKTSRPALWPAQIPIQWVLGDVLWMKWPDGEADHTPLSCAKVQ